jgi:hypothetical protein
MVVAAMRDAEQAARVVGDSDDAGADHEHRQRRRFQEIARPWMTLVPWPVSKPSRRLYRAELVPV